MGVFFFVPPNLASSLFVQSSGAYCCENTGNSVEKSNNVVAMTFSRLATAATASLPRAMACTRTNKVKFTTDPLLYVVKFTY